MTDFGLRMEAEYESIEQTSSAFPRRPWKELTTLELAGVATLLRNFYNGVENVIKQVFEAISQAIPIGSSWQISSRKSV